MLELLISTSNYTLYLQEDVHILRYGYNTNRSFGFHQQLLCSTYKLRIYCWDIKTVSCVPITVDREKAMYTWHTQAV